MGKKKSGRAARPAMSSAGKRKRTNKFSSKPLRAARAVKPAAKRAATSPQPQPPYEPVDNIAAAMVAEDIADATPPGKLPGFHIVGVGASAGGLETCSQLLHALPASTDLAIVIVQHLSPQHESLLAGLLAANSELPVEAATDGTTVEPGKVYIIPPNAHIEINDGGVLRLVPRPTDRSQYMPIDHFFRSLADYAQGRAIGVVLSGNASDGALGLREIKAAGGIAIAQDPKTAKFDSMPRAAVATGVVDLILPVPEIASELVRLSRYRLPAEQAPAAVARPASPPAPSAADGGAMPDENLHLPKVFQLLRNASGVDFSHYKLPTIRRRLHRRMALHKIDQLDRYVRLLQQNAGEVHALYQDILIHVTRFFRDPESFEALRTKVFPRITDRGDSKAPVRIWVPGCSTGEEAYSVAISLLDYLGERAGMMPIQIFATDVAEPAVAHARAGVYPEHISADLSPDQLRRFFSKIDGSYRINKQVRDMCIFARQDLTRDPPFSKLDLIVCRNVLIYLGPVLQRRLMTVFQYALREAGFLMLGSAETIGANSDLFAVVDKRHKIYTKKSSLHRPEIDMPVRHRPAHGEFIAQAVETRGGAPNIQHEANRIVLSRYSPPGVLVDADLKIVQFRGHTGAYLEPAPGEASLDLLKMAREGLLHALRTAVTEARKNGKSVRKEGLRIRHNGNARVVDLEVIPLASANDGRFFLILFDEPHTAAARRSMPAPSDPPESRTNAKDAKGGKSAGNRRSRAGGSAGDERAARLEQELAASREYLQSMIQDLEAANEELQSANEEILSANEELQSTNEELDTAKEELQSTNEELNTVNEELSARNEELSRVNSDLLNIIGNVQIPIVIVTGDLRIRRFTPMAEKILNLIPTDIGRPIGDIKPNIDCPELEQMIAESVDTISARERECRDRDGKLYLLRVRPYKSVDNHIDGAVLALYDIADATRRIDASRREQDDGGGASAETQNAKTPE
jgi:two-component system CheB/CheR fusion protein